MWLQSSLMDYSKLSKKQEDASSISSSSSPLPAAATAARPGQERAGDELPRQLHLRHGINRLLLAFGCRFCPVRCSPWAPELSACLGNGGSVLSEGHRLWDSGRLRTPDRCCHGGAAYAEQKESRLTKKVKAEEPHSHHPLAPATSPSPQPLGGLRLPLLGPHLRQRRCAACSAAAPAWASSSAGPPLRPARGGTPGHVRETL